MMHNDSDWVMSKITCNDYVYFPKTFNVVYSTRKSIVTMPLNVNKNL